MAELKKSLKEKDPILEVDHLGVTYRLDTSEVRVLKDIHFTLPRGKIMTMLGESGSGKSTLGKALLGILSRNAVIDSGEIRYISRDGVPVDLLHCDGRSIRGSKIAMVYQDAHLALNPIKKIRKHFYDVLEKTNKSKAEIEKKALELLRTLEFENPARILDLYPFELSGGMCQRVCIALVLSLEPEMIIADEPTSALDVLCQKEVLNLLKRIQKDMGLSLLLITHDVGVAFEISDQIIVLEKGVIVEQGGPDAIIKNPQHPYTQRLIAAYKVAPLDRSEEQDNPKEVILSLQNVTKIFEKKNDKKIALNNFSIDIGNNETVGILGESGCGKSTLAKCLVGLIHPNSGNILFRKDNLLKWEKKFHKDMCRAIQFVFQDARASLNPRRTAIQLVEEPLKYQNICPPSEREGRARKYLHMVGIDECTQERKPPRLSTGQCQRVAIARALVCEPEILICDESVSALDMIIQDQILQLLEHLQKECNFTMLMISHDIRVIKRSCQRVAVMNKGQLCEYIPVQCLDDEDRSPFTKRLLGCFVNIFEGSEQNS